MALSAILPPPGRENFEGSYAFATIIAEEMGAIGARLRGEAGVRFGYYVNDDAGKEQKLLVEANNRSVYDLPTFGVLEESDCPAVLAEQCFITNASDVEQFATEAGCEAAAGAYYRAICRQLGIEPLANIT